MIKLKKRFTGEFFYFASAEWDFTARLQVIKVLDVHRKNGNQICRVIAKFDRVKDAQHFSNELDNIGKKCKLKNKFVHFILPADYYRE